MNIRPFWIDKAICSWNKTQYDWFPGNSQSSKKFHTKKLGRFIVVFGSYRPKTFKTVNFGQKWPNYDHKWPNFGHLRILPAYRLVNSKGPYVHFQWFWLFAKNCLLRTLSTFLVDWENKVDIISKRKWT